MVMAASEPLAYCADERLASPSNSSVSFPSASGMLLKAVSGETAFFIFAECSDVADSDTAIIVGQCLAQMFSRFADVGKSACRA